MPRTEQARALLRRAHNDAVALDALVGAPGVITAIIGFHAQQACEKGIKAVLARHGVSYRRTRVCNDGREAQQQWPGIEIPVWEPWAGRPSDG
jgi:hypothetical protein